MTTIPMKIMGKLHSAVWVRWQTVYGYLRSSPNVAHVLPWLKLALAKARLVSGSRFGKLTIALDRPGRYFCTVDPGSSSELDVFHEVVVMRNYAFEKLPFKPTLVADCGANIGLFSCLTRTLFPEARIYAWEADKNNFQRLCEQPALQEGSTELFYRAVSNRTGQVKMSGFGTGCEVTGAAPAAKGVDCIDFGEWWEQYAVPGSLLKIDIEGHETIVLPSLRGRWRAPCAVFLETHAAGGRDEETVDELRASGFEVELLRSHSLPKDQRIFKEYCAILCSTH